MSSDHHEAGSHSLAVSLLGLGNMGLAVGQTLLKKGHTLTVWNRTPSKAEPLVAEGATLADSPSACIAASDLVILFLLNDSATYDVLQGIQDLSDKTVLNLTNGTPDHVRKRAEYVQGLGASSYLHGAVMVPPRLVGLPDSLTLYSGPHAALESIATITSALGAAKHVGENPGAASLLDNALLSIMGGLFEGFVQSLALVGRASLPIDEVEFTSDLVVPLLRGFAGWLPRIAEQVKNKEYSVEVGSTLAMQLEALETIVVTARELGLTRGMLGSMQETIREAVQRGKGGEGVAGLVELLTEQ